MVVHVMDRATDAPRRPGSGAAFERYLAEQLTHPAVRAAYDRAGAKLEGVGEVMRTLDLLREQLDLSKAEVARRMDRKPEAISRLLRSSGRVNPTLETLVDLVTALDLQLEIRITRRARGASPGQSHVTVSAKV